MTDIAKCEGEGCGLKNVCWRYLSPSDEYQTFFKPTKTGKECEDFWFKLREDE